MELLYIIVAVIIGSVGSVGLAGLLFVFPNNKLIVISEMLISLAGGTLLGAAFIGMIPKAISLVDEKIMILDYVLLGILVFFVIEKFILWRACYNKDCTRHQNASAQLILIGDAFHNFIDGVIIVTAFHASIPFGIGISFSVFAHEVPQEIADFGILIKNGFSRKKAIVFNMLSAVTALIGAFVAYFALDIVKSIVPYVLAFSASSFIYIALADLVPQMHKTTKIKKSISQILLIIFGIGIIYFIKRI